HSLGSVEDGSKLDRRNPKPIRDKHSDITAMNKTMASVFDVVIGHIKTRMMKKRQLDGLSVALREPELTAHISAFIDERMGISSDDRDRAIQARPFDIQFIKRGRFDQQETWLHLFQFALRTYPTTFAYCMIWLIGRVRHKTLEAEFVQRLSQDYN